MTFNFDTKVFELSEREVGMIMVATNHKPFASGQVAIKLAARYDVNFEQDLEDIIDELDEAGDGNNYPNS